MRVCPPGRKGAHLRAGALVAGLMAAVPWPVAATSCAVGEEARLAREGSRRDSLVRDSVLARIDEILSPLAARREALRKAEGQDSCAEVCGLVKPFCDASSRVCDLAADFPGDSEIQGRCDWSGADCQEVRGACRNCGGDPDGEG